jgi:hypothetical protein
MEFVGEAFLVRKGPEGLIVQPTKRRARARAFRFIDKLLGRCTGFCEARVIIKTPTPGEPGEETVDHVECRQGSCGCHCVSAYEDVGDGMGIYFCECKK